MFWLQTESEQVQQKLNSFNRTKTSCVTQRIDKRPLVAENTEKWDDASRKIIAEKKGLTISGLATLHAEDAED